MQLDRLLSDATGMPGGASKNSRQTALSVMLNERHGAGSISVKGIAKWFERGSIPGPWLLRLAVLPKNKLNLSDYA